MNEKIVEAARAMVDGQARVRGDIDEMVRAAFS
jgi:hypothetical protein